MSNRHEPETNTLVAINNVTTLSTKDVEKYCRAYDKNVRCFRKRDRNNYPYIHALFSSMISATNFLNDRPHFIHRCRINASFTTDRRNGPAFVCVLIHKYTSITEDDLYEYASKQFGRVLNCVLFNSRGYAFIEFAQAVDAHRALASPNQYLNGYPIRFCTRQTSSKVPPPVYLTRLVHIGNFRHEDQEKLPVHFPHLQNFTTHENCYGQIYILGQFDINDSIQLLLKRAFCLNGRVLNIFIDNEDRLTECDNYLLVRNVAYRLTDYNLLEYFSQFGRLLNCYRYGQTNAYRVQYRDRSSLNKVLEFNRIHVIKSVQLQIEHEQI